MGTGMWNNVNVKSRQRMPFVIQWVWQEILKIGHTSQLVFNFCFSPELQVRSRKPRQAFALIFHQPPACQEIQTCSQYYGHKCKNLELVKHKGSKVSRLTTGVFNQDIQFLIYSNFERTILGILGLKGINAAVGLADKRVGDVICPTLSSTGTIRKIIRQ